ncbi:MAG: DNA internalization-related competence protein ComEC/Rec2 [Candidatus Marinimicrobia bacterium]|nr:DNA internalization-related competence protein ComEC/Rec2 [Candidatus Neomarinimicrobiota bacterium]
MLILISGILFYDLIHISASFTWLVIFSLLLIAISTFTLNHHIKSIFSVILIFFIGYSSASFNHIDEWNLSKELVADPNVSFIGEVIELSEDKNKWITLETDALLSEKGKIIGSGIKVRLYLPKYSIKSNIGDSLLIRGLLSLPTDRRNPGGFSLKKWYHSMGITAYMSGNNVNSIKVLSNTVQDNEFSQFINNIRRSLRDRLSMLVLPESSQLANPLILGYTKSIDNVLKDKFRNSGIIHILVISGLHISFIVGILYIIGSLFRLKRNHLIYFILLGITFYAAIVGWRTPVARAVIMAFALLIGIISERKTVALNSLGIAALIILMIMPNELYQPGFQLSFLIVASILFFNNKYLDKLPLPSPTGFINRMIRWFLQFLLITTAANLMANPLTAYHFNMITPFGFLINIIAVPLAGLLVSLGFTMLTLSYIYFPLGAVIGSTFDLLTKLLLSILTFFSGRSGMVISIPEFPIWILVLIIASVFSLGYLDSVGGRIKSFMIMLLIFTGLSLNRSLSYKGAEVTFLDVGQGDAAYIDDSFGRNIIIDTGQSNYGSEAGRFVVGPFLRSKGVNTINYLLLTHQDSDHTGGAIYILENFQVDTLITSYSDSGSSTYLKVLSIAERKNIPRMKTKMGDLIKLGRFSSIRILHPPLGYGLRFANSNNNSSLVFKYNYGESSILFTADIESSAEMKLVKSGYNLKSQLLKVPHHGSSSSSSMNFIEAVSPAEALISVGRNNLYGHPSKEVTERYDKSEIKLKRTDIDMAIVMRLNGKTIDNYNWR